MALSWLKIKQNVKSNFRKLKKIEVKSSLKS